MSSLNAWKGGKRPVTWALVFTARPRRVNASTDDLDPIQATGLLPIRFEPTSAHRAFLPLCCHRLLFVHCHRLGPPYVYIYTRREHAKASVVSRIARSVAIARSLISFPSHISLTHVSILSAWFPLLSLTSLPVCVRFEACPSANRKRPRSLAWSSKLAFMPHAASDHYRSSPRPLAAKRH